MPQLRLLALVGAIGLVGCAADPTANSAASSGAYQATSSADGATSGGTVAGKAAPKISLTMAAMSPSDQSSADYRIAPLDELEITVFQVPDLSKTVQVSASGDIDMPLIGTLPASGKTLSQLKAELTKELSRKYLQSPDVSVSIKDAVSQRIIVEGAVSKPGVYPTTGPATLMTVVALAGGLDRAVADEKGIVVFRKVHGKREAAKFDYKAIREGNAEDPTIQGGDIVVVDESGVKASLRNLRDGLSLFGLFAPLAPLI